MDDISVVIPTMNRVESLIKTLDNLCKGNFLPKEIIIVDQTAEEKKRSMIQSHLKNLNVKTKYIYQNEPSLTKSRNVGMAHVENDLVIQMDDDVDVYENTLYNVHKIFEDKSIAMAAGPNALEENGKSIFGYIFDRKSFIKRRIGHVTMSMYGRYPNKFTGEVKTEWAMGYFFVIRKSLCYKWDLNWDEALKGYAYAEDLDFSHRYFLRAEQENLRCILSKDLTVKHNVSAEWRIPPRKNTFIIVAHREYLRIKHNKGILSNFAVKWADFGELIFRTLYNKMPKDVWDAIIFRKKYKKDIRNGIFHYNEME